MSQWLLCALELCPPHGHHVCLPAVARKTTPALNSVCILKEDMKNTSISSSSLQTVSPTVRLLMYVNVINNKIIIISLLVSMEADREGKSGHHRVFPVKGLMYSQLL